jgi:hypothetical protein
MNRTLLSVVLAAFGALSVAAMVQHGYVGIFAHQFQNLAGLQVLADLVVALTLFMVWMWRDARANGRNPYPWIVLTLTAGSFGPLLYLLSAPGAASISRERPGRSTPHEADRS